MAKVAICIVNLNCLQHTKNLIFDLDRQNFLDFTVNLYDQNSNEGGTEQFLRDMELRKNYTIIRNNHNRPLNHIWNEFSGSASSEFICFLNNDIRITSNYLMDSISVLEKDSRVGIVIHATNNRQFTSASSPTRHALEMADIKQGWEFMLRRSLWKHIPNELLFYCGDDFIFNNIRSLDKRIGVITSSPVIHKLSKTREAMGGEFIDKIKKIALSDIENYKMLGYKHTWNNISKYSRLEPEFSQLTEFNIMPPQLGKYADYHKRLKEHLADSVHISGNIVEISLVDHNTTKCLHSYSIDSDKKFVILYEDFNDATGDIKGKSIIQDLITKIMSDVNIKSNPPTLYNNMMNNLYNLEQISFAFIGEQNPDKLKILLPIIWDKLNTGGTIFLPYFHKFNSEIKLVFDEFFSDKEFNILKTRPQTKPGINDLYMAIKKVSSYPIFNRRTAPLRIATVLKSGGIYDYTYVNKLASAIKRHLTVEYKFACLTDIPENIDTNLVDEIIPLRYGLRGWWSKFELFRPELFTESQVLYFDLDTLIVKNIDDFATYGGDFMALRDFNTLINIGSGIMSWRTGPHINNMFYKFMENLIAQKFNLSQFTGGDQEVIELLYSGHMDWVQDNFPKKMAAFKYECYDDTNKEIRIPEASSVICFHGKPKMADLTHHVTIVDNWR